MLTLTVGCTKPEMLERKQALADAVTMLLGKVEEMASALRARRAETAGARALPQGVRALRPR